MRDIFFFETQAALLMLVMAIALVDAYPRLVVLDDGQIEGIYYLDSAQSWPANIWFLSTAPQRVRISRDDKFVAPSTTNKVSNRGRVGPVYTFVKTDPKANFKWGVRHRVGSQYGR